MPSTLGLHELDWIHSFICNKTRGVLVWYGCLSCCKTSCNIYKCFEGRGWERVSRKSKSASFFLSEWCVNGGLLSENNDIVNVNICFDPSFSLPLAAFLIPTQARPPPVADHPPRVFQQINDEGRVKAFHGKISFCSILFRIVGSFQWYLLCAFFVHLSLICALR